MAASAEDVALGGRSKQQRLAGGPRATEPYGAYQPDTARIGWKLPSFSLERLLPMTLPPPGAPLPTPAEPAALFVYGPMAFPEVMQVLLGRVPVIEEAALAGWRVALVPGRLHPALVQAEAIARGGLIADLSTSEWRLIDAFVGEGYELRQLILADGRRGWAYVGVGQHDTAAAADWDAAYFENHQFTGYLSDCAGWRQAYQAQSRE